jgi:hypothetical protein
MSPALSGFPHDRYCFGPIRPSFPWLPYVKSAPVFSPHRRVGAFRPKRSRPTVIILPIVFRSPCANPQWNFPLTDFSHIFGGWTVFVLPPCHTPDHENENRAHFHTGNSVPVCCSGFTGHSSCRVTLHGASPPFGSHSCSECERIQRQVINQKGT